MASGGLTLLSGAGPPPGGGGEPPMKIGGLREDILFESKEYPLALPKKDSGGVCVVTSSLSLAAAQRAPAHSFRCSSFSHRKEFCGGLPVIFPLTTPLKRPKEGCGPLWKPSRGLRGFRGNRRGRFAARVTGDVGTGDGSPGRSACGHSEHFGLQETRLTMAR